MDPTIAVDAPLENRPGVPMEKTPPAPEPFAPRDLPRQLPRVEVLVEPGRGLTPVYGTAAPPKGLAGAVRRIAYACPDYRARRWLLLLFADRLDAGEARLERLARNPLAWVAAALALTAGAAALVRRR